MPSSDNCCTTTSSSANTASDGKTSDAKHLQCFLATTSCNLQFAVWFNSAFACFFFLPAMYFLLASNFENLFVFFAIANVCPRLSRTKVGSVWLGYYGGHTSYEPDSCETVCFAPWLNVAVSFSCSFQWDVLNGPSESFLSFAGIVGNTYNTYIYKLWNLLKHQSIV